MLSGRLKNAKLVLPGLEPGTFRVWSERDNHYTTELQKNEGNVRHLFLKVKAYQSSTTRTS